MESLHLAPSTHHYIYDVHMLLVEHESILSLLCRFPCVNVFGGYMVVRQLNSFRFWLL